MLLPTLTNLLQPRVLRFGLLQDGDVGVGVLPEGEEIFVGGERPDAGGIFGPSLFIGAMLGRADNSGHPAA
jgi:hypothetical protein